MYKTRETGNELVPKTVRARAECSPKLCFILHHNEATPNMGWQSIYGPLQRHGLSARGIDCIFSTNILE